MQCPNEVLMKTDHVAQKMCLLLFAMELCVQMKTINLFNAQAF